MKDFAVQVVVGIFIAALLVTLAVVTAPDHSDTSRRDRVEAAHKAIHAEGIRAGGNYIPHEACPYQAGSAERREWLKGWIEGKIAK